MASKLLTDSQLKSIRPTGAPQRFNDGDSLVLLVDGTGKMNWIYRFRFGGKANSLSLRGYPEVTLKQAREERDLLKAVLLTGQNPSLYRKTAKLSQRQSLDNTFNSVAKQWHDVWKCDKTPEHAKRVWSRLDANIIPDLGAMPISDISVTLLKTVLKKVETRGALSMTKRVLNTCSQVFSYAINEELIELNPAKNIDAKIAFKPHVEKHYVRINAKELPELLQRIDAYDGEVLTRYALQLMTYTFVRTNELIGARWDEVDFEKKVWRIPAERMKMRIAHIVALSSQALALLKELHKITGGREYVFPNANSPKRHMSNNTMLYALYRMGYQSRMTGHGFRGVASTILHEQGYNKAHIEVQLAHKDKDKVSSAYNFAEYLEPRAKMLQEWADFLDEIKQGEGASNRRPA